MFNVQFGDFDQRASIQYAAAIDPAANAAVKVVAPIRTHREAAIQIVARATAGRATVDFLATFGMNLTPLRVLAALFLSALIFKRRDVAA